MNNYLTWLGRLGTAIFGRVGSGPRFGMRQHPGPRLNGELRSIIVNGGGTRSRSLTMVESSIAGYGDVISG